MNEVTETGQTALHLAVHQGHARTVERLVGFGIDLNMQDSDGDTALHIALAIAILGSTAKFNSCQYFWLYSMRIEGRENLCRKRALLFLH